MKDGALVCNTGHYDCEINLVDLEARCQGHARDPRRPTRSTPSRTAAASTCWPRAAWSTWPPPRATPRRSWTCRSPTSTSALCKLARDGKGMKPGVYELPPEQDQELARIKLTHPGPQHRRADRRSRSPTATTTPPGPRGSVGSQGDHRVPPDRPAGGCPQPRAARRRRRHPAVVRPRPRSAAGEGKGEGLPARPVGHSPLPATQTRRPLPAVGER